MRLLRGLAGTLLWIVAALLGLVGIILCVTVILLPVGLPLLTYARHLLTFSLKLILPPAASHPVRTAERSARKRGRKTKKGFAASVPDLKKVRTRSRDQARRVWNQVPIGS